MTRQGFTIVELLIVVVVIAILAAITTVAYGGIRQRAEDSRIISAVNGYQKIIELYRVEHGSLPAGYDWVCLGEQAQYPATSVFASGQCNTSSNNYWSSSLTAELQPFVKGSLPDPTYTARKANTTGFSRGLIYDSSSAHTGNSATITYYLEGQKTCPIGDFREYRDSNRVTVCNLIMRH